MSAFEHVPTFPTAIGEEGAVEFTKDGRQFRITRLDEDQLVIHQAGRTEEQFVLYIHNFSRDRVLFDVDGIGDMAAVGASGVPHRMLSRLF